MEPVECFACGQQFHYNLCTTCSIECNAYQRSLDVTRTKLQSQTEINQKFHDAIQEKIIRHRVSKKGQRDQHQAKLHLLKKRNQELKQELLCAEEEWSRQMANWKEYQTTKQFQQQYIERASETLAQRVEHQTKEESTEVESNVETMTATNRIRGYQDQHLRSLKSLFPVQKHNLKGEFTLGDHVWIPGDLQFQIPSNPYHATPEKMREEEQQEAHVLGCLVLLLDALRVIFGVPNGSGILHFCGSSSTLEHLPSGQTLTLRRSSNPDDPQRSSKLLCQYVKYVHRTSTVMFGQPPRLGCSLLKQPCFFDYLLALFRFHETQCHP